MRLVSLQMKRRLSWWTVLALVAGAASLGASMVAFLFAKIFDTSAAATAIAVATGW